LITGSDSKNSFPKIKATLSLPPLKHVWFPCLKYTITPYVTQPVNKFRH
jgi:hypothetical protein